MKIHDLIETYVDNHFVMSGKASSLSIVGDKLYSYDTVIAERGKDGVFIINKTKYSSTTTTQQNYLMKLLEERELPRRYVVGRVDVGTQTLIGLPTE